MIFLHISVMSLQGIEWKIMADIYEVLTDYPSLLLVLFLCTFILAYHSCFSSLLDFSHFFGSEVRPQHESLIRELRQEHNQVLDSSPKQATFIFSWEIPPTFHISLPMLCLSNWTTQKLFTFPPRKCCFLLTWAWSMDSTLHAAGLWPGRNLPLGFVCEWEAPADCLPSSHYFLWMSHHFLLCVKQPTIAHPICHADECAIVILNGDSSTVQVL